MYEQLYKDFTEKLLPKIQEGLVISKDYFADLFGRYIKFLILTDSLLLVFGSFLVILGCFFCYKAVKYEKSDRYDDGRIGWVVATGFSFFIGMLFIFTNSYYLIKDIYVPEVRIYEILKHNN